MMTPPQHAELRARYDSLWANALSHFARAGVEVDPHLLQPEQDGRRGLTLLARPAEAVSARISNFLGQLTPVLPGQYLYPRASLHMTVLSLFTATEAFAAYYEQLPAYQRAVEQVVRQVTPFTISFRGITASPGSIMLQGFPHGAVLNQTRDALRAALTAEGLTRGLDTRYRLTTAHVTVLRFERQPVDMAALQTALTQYRDYDFGEMRVERLELVKNDWYMSPDKVSLVAAYRLLS